MRKLIVLLILGLVLGMVGCAQMSEPESEESVKERLIKSAEAYRKAGMFEKAVQAYQNARAIDPKDKEIYYNLAVIYDEHLNRPEQAVICYDKFLELAPADDPRRMEIRDKEDGSLY